MSASNDLDYIKCVPRTATRLLLAVNGGRPITTTARSPVPGGAELDDLGVVGPGLLFASGMYLAAVGRLAAQVAEDGKNHDWHAAPLLRSLYEYVVTFCWVVADDTGARATAWAAEDKRIRLAVDREIAVVGATRRLCAETRASFEAAVAAAGNLPPVPQRAREADLHWAPIIPQFEKHHTSTNPGPFTDFYPLVYRNCSSIGHPTPRALQECFVHAGAGAGEFVIGTADGPGSRYFYTQAPMIFSYALLVAGQLYSWADGDCLDEAFGDWPQSNDADVT